MPRRRTTAVSRKELAYYRTHILEALREDGVVCLECGHLYQGLANHLRLHGLTGAAYREKWGYNRGTALIPPAVHERLRQVALDRNFSAYSLPDALQRALAAKQGRQPDPRPEARVRNRAAIQARFAAGWRPTEKLKKVTDAEILTLREAGLWASQIAAQTGLTTSAVKMRLRMLRKRGVPVPPAKSPRPNPWRRATEFGTSARHGRPRASRPCWKGWRARRARCGRPSYCRTRVKGSSSCCGTTSAGRPSGTWSTGGCRNGWP